MAFVINGVMGGFLGVGIQIYGSTENIKSWFNYYRDIGHGMWGARGLTYTQVKGSIQNLTALTSALANLGSG